MLNRVVAEINGKMERDVHGVVDDARRNAYNEIRVSIEKIVSDIKNEIVEKTSGEMLHFAVSEIDKSISGNIHRVIKDECSRHENKKNDECSRHENKKNDDDFERREKPDRHAETAIKNDLQAEKQAEIIEKLLKAEQENPRSEVYADNWNKPKFFETPGDRSEPVDMLRRRILEKMKDSYDTSVISTVSNEVDMSAILALEKIFGSAFSKKHNTRLGFTPFFISASIAALKQYGIFNSHILNNEIIYKNYFDISIITCGNDGIAAPVIRNADILTIAEIERAMIHLSKRAVEGTLSVEEVSGGTFTVVNAGIYGSLIGTDLLTPPQVATLSVHKMSNRPIATDKGVEVKPMLYISLSYDHRVSDTGKASEFLSNIKNYVENPGWQILGLSEV
jgi:2-oxoglutarate dehydrogenase E2 component (dihydrolipoamide succinyltransferase)